LLMSLRVGEADGLRDAAVGEGEESSWPRNLAAAAAARVCVGGGRHRQVAGVTWWQETGGRCYVVAGGSRLVSE
jgi:hypothetical protein